MSHTSCHVCYPDDVISLFSAAVTRVSRLSPVPEPALLTNLFSPLESPFNDVTHPDDHSKICWLLWAGKPSLGTCCTYEKPSVFSKQCSSTACLRPQGFSTLSSWFVSSFISSLAWWKTVCRWHSLELHIFLWYHRLTDCHLFARLFIVQDTARSQMYISLNFIPGCRSWMVLRAL